MKNLLNSVKVEVPNSNLFDLTHDHKTSMKMGQLIPIMVAEVIPGDRVSISAETLIRFMPLIAPVMQRMDATIHYFYVPNRLLWDNWEKFISPKKAGDPIPAHPYLTCHIGMAQPGTLWNYMGIPDNAINTPSINPLPMAAYVKIYNEYYRDENLQPELDYKLQDGNNDGAPIAANGQTIRYRAWEHDYFTSCLPFAQKGQPVDIPVSGSLGGKLPVQYDNSSIPDNTPVAWTTTAPAGLGVGAISDNTGPSTGALFVDMGTGAGTMNDLRTAMRLQEYLEKNARGGTRYTEHLRLIWGVTSSDARLQRAEYITGSKTPVIVSEVLNTTGESGGLPQGNMSGHAISADSGHQGSYFCEDHGFIIGIMSVLPKTSYYQGLHKMWQRWDPTDYAIPDFAHLGEQAVSNNEIFVDHTNPTEVFGYLPRYTEYKVRTSYVTGDMQTTLDYWTMARKFDPAAEPNLNSSFITSNPRSDIFAVDDGTDYLVCHVLHRLQANRRLPVFGQPTF